MATVRALRMRITVAGARYDLFVSHFQEAAQRSESPSAFWGSMYLLMERASPPLRH